MIFLNIDEFKTTFKKYRMGNLTPEAEEKFEGELEKLDEYQAFIEMEIGGTQEDNNYLQEEERKIFKRSQSSAYIRMGLVSLIISLLLLPTLNVLAMAFNIVPLK